jgi:transposase
LKLSPLRHYFFTMLCLAITSQGCSRLLNGSMISSETATPGICLPIEEYPHVNSRDQQRQAVLEEVIQGHIAVTDACPLLGLSERQVRRLLAAYRERGAAALGHGNRGRKPAHAFGDGLRQRIAELATTTYAGCSRQELSAILREREGISVSRATIHRILAEASPAGVQAARRTQNGRRTARYPQEGMLLWLEPLQIRWREGDPGLTLLAAVDDATGSVPSALFRAQEDLKGYFLLLERIVTRYGRPLAVTCHVESTIPDDSEEREARAGERWPAQVLRLLEELAIISVNRAVLPDQRRAGQVLASMRAQLTPALRRSGAETLSQANAALGEFLLRFSPPEAVAPAVAGTAYRPLPEGMTPEAVFCFKDTCVVAADNTVQVGKRQLQILPTDHRTSFARTHVEIREQLDGRAAIYYMGVPVPSREVTILRARYGRLAVSRPDSSAGIPAHLRRA